MGFYYGRWRTEQIIVWDTIVYYEYLTAAFMFNDISFQFAFELPDDFDGEIWLETGPNGERYPKTTLGVAIMLTPTYLVAMLLNNLFGLGSYGYSSFFQFFIFLAGIFHYLAGLIVLRKLLSYFFTDKVIATCLILLSLATGLFYYAGVDPGLSHVYSFFLYASFVLITINWYKRTSIKNSLLLGLVLGLITLIRPSNGLMVLVPALYGIYDFASLKSKFTFLYKNLPKLFLSVLVFAFVVFLQFWFWKHATGNWFMYSYGDEGFFWNDPKFAEGLFGFRKGLFIYTPILLLSLPGFFLVKKDLRALKLAIVVFLVLNAYVILSWWCWWYGGGYGHRAFVESFVLFSFLLCLVIERVYRSRKKILRLSFYLFSGFFIILNLFQIRQYDRGQLHWDSMTFKSYKEVFFKDHTTKEFWDYLDIPDYEEAKKGNR